MNSFFEKKRVLITGACGTIGSELVRQLLQTSHADEIVAIDNNESELFFLEQKFSNYSQSRCYLADVRDKEKLVRIMKGIDVVFHTAAFKHVILCERSPFEAVRTNILGVQNIVNAAMENNVERVVFTSSDKAVNPTNVMGTSKLMGERLMTAACNNLRGEGPIFTSTRFGNVLGSRGSVIPIFREQIRKGGPVTLTDPEMTRFIMSIQEAVQLVIDSVTQACGGEVFITKMPVIRIQDLAEVMIEELAPVYGHEPANVPVRLIGSKPGEKMYEELMNDEETRRTWELDRYFVTLPAFIDTNNTEKYTFSNLRSKIVKNPYNSANETALSKIKIKQFLMEHRLLFDDLSHQAHPDERFWPDSDLNRENK